MFSTNTIPEAEIYEVLANRRRRETIRELMHSSDADPISLHQLSTEVATRETGQAPPPSGIRESVYNSLHQTHLPKLHELGIVHYDRDDRTVQLHTRARDVDRYMAVEAGYGVTWSELYRTLGVLSLTVLLAALLETPVIGHVDPLLWSAFFLATFTVAIAAHLWSNRWQIARALQIAR
ncbi:hypothetical protein D8Y22_07160 [Salinadaptatus halalkaliphilus]|uniref:DUF7344 domain-containing protein n=1 Tax=Salinadaptatus halalkaliphilus TaxID=2419781 RepID=A0A4S3TQQ5_9EURY|nr:hypothetical protein [Salinadaptatus halalkaliphilus]THE65585.1 hypothetical protein D8Y22_07160 [Salinadaptatus halalkaliphilus]